MGCFHLNGHQVQTVISGKADLISSLSAAAAAAAFRFWEAFGLRSSESGRLRCNVGNTYVVVVQSV